MSQEVQIVALVINAAMVVFQSGVLRELKCIRRDLDRLLDPENGELAKMNARLTALEARP